MRLAKFIRFLQSKTSRRLTTYKQRNLRVSTEDVKKRSDNCVVRELNWEEVERLTCNLSDVIGYGGFSAVYFGASPTYSSVPAAFKIQNSSERLDLIFKEELSINLRIQHDNIVKLHGYCNSQDRKVLIFEYIANRTLHENLHNKACEGGSVIPWKKRIRIAFQLAQTIEYLHDKCGLNLIHHDLKSSNILLDENFNCKLCDFGSAKLGFSSDISPPYPSRKQVMMGSPGYMDPSYLITGIASEKNDIYSFGVLVLELVTGMEAITLERTLKKTSLKDNAVYLTEWMDPRLCGSYDLEEAKFMVSISEHCLHVVPGLRPSATQIIQTMKERVPSVTFSP